MKSTTPTRAKAGGRALLAVLLALALALSWGLALPQQRAFAVDTNCTYEVTTSATDPVTVNAYQIFEGDVDVSTNAISNVSWGPHSAEVIQFLEKPISETGASMPYGTWLYKKGFSTTDLTKVSLSSMTADNLAAFTSAENALAYIVDEINASSGVKSAKAGKITAYGSFSNNLADYLHNSDTATADVSKEAVSGNDASFTGLREGFYLFYTYADDDSYSPIWTPVDATGRSGAVKNQDVLTTEKTVFDDDSNTWGKITDAGSGDMVTFHVTATLPKKAATVPFKYILHDTLTDGLSIYTIGPLGTAIPEMRVYAIDSSGAELGNITDAFTATQGAGNTFTISCTDLYQTNDASADAAIKSIMNDNDPVAIVFEYKASVNVEAHNFEGTSYSNNEAYLEYGTDDDPFETTPDSAYVATYELQIKKIDSDTGKEIDGAKFTVSTVDDEGNTVYLQSDSILGSTPYEFVSGSGSYPDVNQSAWGKGVVAVPIIDAGTYTITETAAPAGYKPPASDTTNVVITATKNVPGGAVTALSATADNNVTPKATLGSGIVEIEIPNDPSTVLPITGMTPNQLGTVIGILLVAAGVMALVVRSRRKANGRA